MAPPESPSFFEVEPEAAAVDEAAEEVEAVADAVGELVRKVIKAVIVGSTTPAHLWSAFEL